jgi:alkylhydroperoxidase/carboxymuconolactone decarboxylase family protein YurZ
MTPEQQQELERTTELRGFRYGLHDFFAEVDLDALRRSNDEAEASYLSPSLIDRRTKELLVLAACIALADEVPHLQVHLHAASKEGLTPEELLEAINLIGKWVSLPARARALEAWRATFRPDIPTIERVVELR